MKELVIIVYKLLGSFRTFAASLLIHIYVRSNVIELRLFVFCRMRTRARRDLLKSTRFIYRKFHSLFDMQILLSRWLTSFPLQLTWSLSDHSLVVKWQTLFLLRLVLASKSFKYSSFIVAGWIRTENWPSFSGIIFLWWTKERGALCPFDSFA